MRGKIIYIYISIIGILFVFIASVHAQSITITDINPPSITVIKNQEFSVAVSYSISGTFDSCYLSVDETTLPAGWQITETNPKQIDCSSGTSYIPKIIATTTGSAEIRIVVEGKGISPQQASKSIYVTVKEGAILDASLISPSSISVQKGKTYTIEFNVKNNGDIASENAVATITCPSGYSCPSSLILKEAGQNDGVIRAGYTAFASFEIKANNPSNGDVEIKVSAANSPITDTIKVHLSYSAPTKETTPVGEEIPSIGIRAPSKEKLKNATIKLKLIPGIGLRNNTKLQKALEKVLGKKLSSQAIENLIRLSASISANVEVVKEFKAEANKSILSMKMKYKGRKKVKNFIIYDSIPKSFANSSDLINITAPGATIEVVEHDPEYLFVYPEVNPEQELTITYETIGEKDASLINETKTEIYAESLEEAAPPAKKKICTPGSKRCIGNELQQCSADGTSWKVIETCEYGCDNKTLSCKSKPPSRKVDYTWLLIIAVIIVLIGIGIYRKRHRKKEVDYFTGL